MLSKKSVYLQLQVLTRRTALYTENKANKRTCYLNRTVVACWVDKLLIKYLTVGSACPLLYVARGTLDWSWRLSFLSELFLRLLLPEVVSLVLPPPTPSLEEDQTDPSVACLLFGRSWSLGPLLFPVLSLLSETAQVNFVT